MLNICLVLILSASVLSESVRETETWMPMKTTQTVDMTTRHEHLESSGDSVNGSDFGFTDDEDDDDEDYYSDPMYDDEDKDEDYELSGSGDGETTVSPVRDSKPSVKPEVNDNKIPEVERPVWPTVDLVDLVQNRNEIQVTKEEEEEEAKPSNVLMSHASEDSIFNKTEVLAALIAGGAVGLMFAVLLILLLIYRMKKKDEGSYELGKKPIYKKAPTTEIYA
ncbi:syndecan-4 isoform X2 [Anarrhichthys ocellatus]|uniref:syndecan-4 isoform X2 n=1 Tax=Anarrhichthys ocellatus TaxID=433405 RepID=UPI0012EEA2A0|nr:syndecan-4-like isoform X2 [Anarrhichthys ocellatus]